MSLRRHFEGGRWVEPFLAVLIVVGLVNSLLFLFREGYLPVPFFYEPSDTFADWFNTAYWARDPGAYDLWNTIYPPLSFVFMRLVGLDYCYPTRRPFDFSAGLVARDCDWLGLVAIFAIFLLNIVLVWCTYRKLDRRTALPRTICVALGLPMIDGLERGNLVLISFTCLLLAYAPLVKSARLRWIAIGLAVNFKVYLIATILPLLLKRRWRWAESALIAVVVVYIGSYAILGRGTPIEIFDNIREFSSRPAAAITDLWYTTTYTPFVSLLEGDIFPFNLIIGSHNVDRLLIIIPIIWHGTQALIIFAAIGIWLRPEAVPVYRAINLGLMLALITSEAGGYTQVYFMLFVMMEPWRGIGRKWAIITCYLLAVPWDLVIDKTPEMARESYFGDATVMINYYVTAGPFIRPLMVLTVGIALACVTIRQVWNDVHYQGWRTRWRYRRDFPIMVGEGQAIPPVRSA
jgi:hypothetical protein